MSSSNPPVARDMIDGIARPLIVVLGAFVALLLVAAVISGLLIRELRSPLVYASENAFTVAAQLRNMQEAADKLDLLVTNTQFSALTDANAFVEKAAVSRQTIDAALAALPPSSRDGLHLDVLDEQYERLVASLQQASSAASFLWAKQKRAEALGLRILSVTDDTIDMARAHRVKYAENDDEMSRLLGEARYYFSTMSSFASAIMVAPEEADVDNAANLYAVNLRRVAATMSRLPQYAERSALFDNAQILFDLGHAPDGYFGTTRSALNLHAEFSQTRARYKEVSAEFRSSIKTLAATNDQTTATTLRAARVGLGRYQSLLIASTILTMLFGLLVIKRYVFDAVVARLRDLRNATLAMAAGNLETFVDARGDDEISDLAQALGSFRNVSLERARSEERLRQRTAQLELANKELDQFAYVASHDLRAPLHGIDSLASFVQEDMEGKLPPDSRRHLMLMRARIKRLHSLLDDLLEFSRIGHEKAETAWARLDTLITGSAEMVEDPAFEMVFDVEETEVLFTTTPFEQVVRNLVDNAIKHHDRDTGTVFITATVKQGAVHLDITDDGPGIRPKFHNRIFGMFQTLQARDKIKGSGMGLAYLNKLTMYYDAKISVRSDPEKARGTTFCVEWPVMDQRAIH